MNFELFFWSSFYSVLFSATYLQLYHTAVAIRYGIAPGATVHLVGKGVIIRSERSNKKERERQDVS